MDHKSDKLMISDNIQDPLKVAAAAVAVITKNPSRSSCSCEQNEDENDRTTTNTTTKTVTTAARQSNGDVVEDEKMKTSDEIEKTSLDFGGGVNLPQKYQTISESKMKDAVDVDDNKQQESATKSSPPSLNSNNEMINNNNKSSAFDDTIMIKKYTNNDKNQNGQQQEKNSRLPSPSNTEKQWMNDMVTQREKASKASNDTMKYANSILEKASAAASATCSTSTGPKNYLKGLSHLKESHNYDHRTKLDTTGGGSANETITTPHEGKTIVNEKSSTPPPVSTTATTTTKNGNIEKLENNTSTMMMMMMECDDDGDENNSFPSSKSKNGDRVVVGDNNTKPTKTSSLRTSGDHGDDPKMKHFDDSSSTASKSSSHSDENDVDHSDDSESDMDDDEFDLKNHRTTTDYKNKSMKRKRKMTKMDDDDSSATSSSDDDSLQDDDDNAGFDDDYYDDPTKRNPSFIGAKEEEDVVGEVDDVTDEVDDGAWRNNDDCNDSTMNVSKDKAEKNRDLPSFNIENSEKKSTTTAAAAAAASSNQSKTIDDIRKDIMKAADQRLASRRKEKQKVEQQESTNNDTTTTATNSQNDKRQIGTPSKAFFDDITARASRSKLYTRGTVEKKDLTRPTQKLSDHSPLFKETMVKFKNPLKNKTMDVGMKIQIPADIDAREFTVFNVPPRGVDPRSGLKKKNKNEKEKSTADTTNDSGESKETYIATPHAHDVLSGRGGLTNQHCGNEWYRRLIRSNRWMYLQCRKHTKLMVAKAMVQAVHQRSPPGRFLEMADKENGLWHEISYKRAVDKSSQALREKIEEKQQQQQGSPYKSKKATDDNEVDHRTTEHTTYTAEYNINNNKIAFSDTLKGLCRDGTGTQPFAEKDNISEVNDTRNSPANPLVAADRTPQQPNNNGTMMTHQTVATVGTSPMTHAAAAMKSSSPTTTTRIGTNNPALTTSSPQQQVSNFLNNNNSMSLNSGIYNSNNWAFPNSPMMGGPTTPMAQAASPQQQQQQMMMANMMMMNNSSINTNSRMQMMSTNKNNNTTNSMMMRNSPLSPSVMTTTTNMMMANSPINTPTTAAVTMMANSPMGAATSPVTATMSMATAATIPAPVLSDNGGKTVPRTMDVLCGRGGAVKKTPGNQAYTQLVNKNKVRYINSAKSEKLLVSRSIVNAIYQQNGRFLDRDTTGWYIVSDKKALEKTSQALREGQPKLRDEMEKAAAEHGLKPGTDSSQVATENVRADIHGMTTIAPNVSASSIERNLPNQSSSTMQHISVGGNGMNYSIHDQRMMQNVSTSMNNGMNISIRNQNMMQNVSAGMNNGMGLSIQNQNSFGAMGFPNQNYLSSQQNAQQTMMQGFLNSNPMRNAKSMTPNFASHDVICDKGQEVAQHPGNERFRALVKARSKDTYRDDFTPYEKKALAWEIVKHIHSLNPPGRFLQQVNNQTHNQGLAGPFEVLNQKKSIERAYQALQYYNRQHRDGNAASPTTDESVTQKIDETEARGQSLKDNTGAAMPMTQEVVNGHHKNAIEFALSSNGDKAKTTLAANKTNSVHAGIKRKLNPIDADRIRENVGFISTAQLKSAVNMVKMSNALDIPGVKMRPSGNWQAQVYFSGASRYVGVFDTREKAALACVITSEKLKSVYSPGEIFQSADACFEAARTTAYNGVNQIYPSLITEDRVGVSPTLDLADINVIEKLKANSKGKGKKKKSKRKRLPTKPSKILQLYLPFITGGKHRSLMHN